MQKILVIGIGIIMGIFLYFILIVCRDTWGCMYVPVNYIQYVHFNNTHCLCFLQAFKDKEYYNAGFLYSSAVSIDNSHIVFGESSYYQ
jgi:hypothetical protein